MSQRAALPLILLASGILWLSQSGGKKKRKDSGSTGDLPPDSCGLYPWLPKPVDAAIRTKTDAGERDPDALALHAAREVYGVTPEGRVQPWPHEDGDARAQCIFDRIQIRVNLILAQVADDEADEDDDPPQTPSPPGGTFAPLPGTCPEGYRYDDVLGCLEKPPPPHEFAPFEGPEGDPVGPDPEPQPPEGQDQWPDYPDPGPVDLDPWTDPGNYPTPGKFHQIGGENSGVTLKKIARKALTTAFYLVHGDLDVADQLARRSENWRTYRQIVNCCPWNHLMYGAPNLEDEVGYYATPNGESISLYPVHDHVQQALTQGQTPERRVRDDDRRMPKGGKHAFLWLPPLDELALSEGRVEVKREYWETGDWMIMPPPEVLTLGVITQSDRHTWGCDGWELEFMDETALSLGRGWFRPRHRVSLQRRAG